jgi:hypothetical protein
MRVRGEICYLFYQIFDALCYRLCVSNLHTRWLLLLPTHQVVLSLRCIFLKITIIFTFKMLSLQDATGLLPAFSQGLNDYQL